MTKLWLAINEKPIYPQVYVGNRIGRMKRD